MKDSIEYLLILLFCLLSILLIPSGSVFGQDISLSSSGNLRDINVDKLTDNQILEFIRNYEETGFTTEQMGVYAQANGIPYAELQKLKKRIESLKDLTVNNTSQSPKKPLRQYSPSQTRINENLFSSLFNKNHEEEIPKGSTRMIPSGDNDPQKIFGMDLFSKDNLSFAPNINIPTPKNYILGTGDEIYIEIYGASQESYHLILNPEGKILIPGLGPVLLGGLSFEQAENRLKNRLSTIYSGMKSPVMNTFAEISLGNIRSIHISITGEARLPGSYTLPSLSTLFNALYLAGGPGERGTFRNIKLIRNNEVYAISDVYQFLLSGITQNNKILQDQDVIFIEPYSTRAEIRGEIKRPGIYELTGKESLAKLLEYAGGFTEDAFKAKINIIRNTPGNKKLLDVNYENIDSVNLQNGDQIIVEKILSRFENRVGIKGAVYREGYYELKENTGIQTLIENAGGLRNDAYLMQASLYRLDEHENFSLISVNLETLLQQNKDYDLRNEDLLYITSINDMEEEKNLQIKGEIKNPGMYPWFEGINLGEVIRMAGGLKESASFARLEIARRLRNNTSTQKESNTAEIYSFTLPVNLHPDSVNLKFRLEPNDIIFIRRSPGYEEQQIITIEGEICFPGEYSLKNNQERLSDLIGRAGGLTNQAYPQGATLIRKTEADHITNYELMKKQFEHSIGDTISSLSSPPTGEQAIGINLPYIIQNPGSPEDLFLKSGDKLRIPSELQTVKISGALLYPVTVKYEKMKGVRHYIANAGGFNENARKSKTYVIYANGSVNRTRCFIGIKNYPDIEPGAEIIVPLKPEKNKISPQQAISTSSAIASLALVIVSLIGKF